VGRLRCRALLRVLPMKLTRDKAHAGQWPTSIKFGLSSGSGVSALFQPEAVAVHLQYMHVVGEAIQESAGEAL
jgi:hypothetical protein